MGKNPPAAYPGVDTIRQIQELMLVCALMPPQSRLADLLRIALATPHQAARKRVEPIRDLDAAAMYLWFEKNWPLDSLSPEEKELIEMQNNSDLMGESIAVLRDVEAVIGIKLVGTLKS